MRAEDDSHNDNGNNETNSCAFNLAAYFEDCGLFHIGIWLVTESNSKWNEKQSDVGKGCPETSTVSRAAQVRQDDLERISQIQKGNKNNSDRCG
jgi:hypothetical protein